MSRQFVRAPLGLVAIALLTACGPGQRTERASSEEGSTRESSNDAANAQATAATVSGVASYRERMALPADATFEATLQDVSRADAPADVIAQTRLDPAGQPPFRFEIKYAMANSTIHFAAASLTDGVDFGSRMIRSRPISSSSIDSRLIRPSPTSRRRIAILPMATTPSASAPTLITASAVAARASAN
jgi:uncharacterized lipoprotein YbaY